MSIRTSATNHNRRPLTLADGPATPPIARSQFLPPLHPPSPLFVICNFEFSPKQNKPPPVASGPLLGPTGDENGDSFRVGTRCSAVAAHERRVRARPQTGHLAPLGGVFRAIVVVLLVEPVVMASERVSEGPVLALVSFWTRASWCEDLHASSYVPRLALALGFCVGIDIRAKVLRFALLTYKRISGKRERTSSALSSIQTKPQATDANTPRLIRLPQRKDVPRHSSCTRGTSTLLWRRPPSLATTGERPWCGESVTRATQTRRAPPCGACVFG